MIQTEAFIRHLVPCTIRDYTPADYDACAAVYASNVPVPHPKAALAECLRFLEEGTSYHLVLEHEGRVIGCGGLELRGEGPFAHLVFGFIHRDFQGKGFGTTLLAARLSLIEHEGQTISVSVETGTEAVAFFARFGFELVGVRANKVGPRQDAGQLLLQVRPEEVEALHRTLIDRGLIFQIASPAEEEMPSERLDE